MPTMTLGAWVGPVGQVVGDLCGALEETPFPIPSRTFDLDTLIAVFATTPSRARSACLATYPSPPWVYREIADKHSHHRATVTLRTTPLGADTHEWATALVVVEHGTMFSDRAEALGSDDTCRFFCRYEVEEVSLTGAWGIADSGRARIRRVTNARVAALSEVMGRQIRPPLVYDLDALHEVAERDPKPDSVT